MNTRRTLTLLPLALLLPTAVLRAQASGRQPRTISWDDLLPADWDPLKHFKGLDLADLEDGDPRALAMQQQMREIWDAAPVNQDMLGQQVRLPGFVVPLEDSRDGMKEFLLVPYLGACIHNPPPPANQLVHVLPGKPAKGLRTMSTVWVSGPLGAVRTDSAMGTAGYRIAGADIAPYRERGR